MNWLNFKKDTYQFTIVFLSAITNYKLNQMVVHDIVISSLLSSFVGIVLFKLTKQKHFLSYVYIGVFIGMSTYDIQSIFLSLIISSLISVFVISISSNIFWGFGGKLGTIAFVSCLIPYLLKL